MKRDGNKGINVEFICGDHIDLLSQTRGHMASKKGARPLGDASAIYVYKYIDRCR